MKTSQAFSMDIMIALVVFIGTIFVFYSIIEARQDGKTDDLQDEASIVLENIASEDSNIGILDGTEIDETKLQQLLGEDYAIIKEKMRVKNDFCIFLEDEDGDIIYINKEPGIGSGKIKISGEGCNPECNDGINNNDGDELIDFPADPDCSNLLDDDESS